MAPWSPRRILGATGFQQAGLSSLSRRRRHLGRIRVRAFDAGRGRAAVDPAGGHSRTADALSASELPSARRSATRFSRIGRSSVKTTTSAITAQACIRNCARWSRHSATPAAPIWIGAGASRTAREPYTFTRAEPRYRRPFPGLDDDEQVRHKGELVYPNLFLSVACDHVAAFILWPPRRGAYRYHLPFPVRAP